MGGQVQISDPIALALATVLMIKSIIGLVLSSTLIMPRLRKSKSPTTPTLPGEPARKPKPPPQGVSRAHTATSTGIAPSIASPFYDSYGVSSGSNAVQKRGENWKTVYSMARMTVELTKESSDMFLPLKAVAGAVSVLIRNYDVSVSFQQTKHLLILFLLLIPANIG